MDSPLNKFVRLLLRLWVLVLAIVRQGIPREKSFPSSPQQILILHSLLLGDTLLLTPLLAKLRLTYPTANIRLTVPYPLLPLYKSRPYGVDATPFHPKEPRDVKQLLNSGPYDLVVIPAENRFSLLARASGSRHTAAFKNDRPTWKNWMIDTKIPLPSAQMAIGDIFTTLIPGKFDQHYNPNDWPSPTAEECDKVDEHSIIMHLTASMETKMWPLEKWLDLAIKVHQYGYSPIWSIAPGEEKILSRVDPESIFPYIALRFTPMWRALERSRLLISVDTSIVHLARLTQTPTVVIIGPTDPILFGNGVFWSEHQEMEIYSENIGCRDDNNLFRRPLPWVSICTRNIKQCKNPQCIHDISVDNIYDSITLILSGKT